MRIAAALLLLSACYSPQPAPGAPCPDHVCPTGLVCSPATQTCELRAIDAGATFDVPGIVDARIDGLPDAYVPPTPALEQQATSYANTGASLSASLPVAPTTGHLLVVIAGTPTAPLASVSGGGVATWQLAVRSTVQSNVEIWYGITNGSSGTVIVGLPGNTSPIWLHVSEWSALTGALDGVSANDGIMAPASAGSATTTKRDLLMFAVSEFAPTTFGNPTPGTWTAMSPIDGLVKQREWYRIEPTPGTYGPSVSITNGNWDAALAAFVIQN